MDVRSTSSAIPIYQKYPYRTGAGTGIVAFLLGYVITYLTSVRLTTLITENPPVSDLPTSPSREVVVGWFFVNAHLVTIEFQSADWSDGGVNYVILVGELSRELLLVPPILLFCAGFLVGYLLEVRERTGVLWTGLSLIPGYLFCSIVVAIAAVVTFPREAAEFPGGAGPELFPVMVLMGITYPLVFGAAGAGAVTVWRKRTNDEPPRERTFSTH